jgi:hypothetical protein
MSNKWLKTPEAAGNEAAKNTLHSLFHPQREPLKTVLRGMKDNPEMARLVEALSRDAYSMFNAKRDLGIDEPKEPIT